jgi:hypothetical protein
MAFNSAARLLVLSILYSVNAAPAPDEDHVQAHCARMLTAASTIRDLHVEYVYLRLLLPLRVVAMSGTPEQREKVRDMVPNCALEKGVFGSILRGNCRGCKKRVKGVLSV